MSLNQWTAPPTGPYLGRWFCLVAGVLLLGAVGFCQLSEQVTAGPPEVGRLPDTVIGQADTHYRAGRLPQAEELYRLALTRAAAEERRHCYERLLAIYVQVGRLDQAITLGEQYADWLRTTGPLARARELLLDLGAWYLTLGHHASAESFLRRGMSEVKNLPLSPARRGNALTQLALAVERQGNRVRAAGAWQQVKDFAQRQLNRPPGEVSPQDRIAYARGMVEYFRFHHESTKVPLFLEIQLTEQNRLADWTGKRDTLRLLAANLAAQQDYAEAAKRLREALQVHEKRDPLDRFVRANIACELAAVQQRQGLAAAALQTRQSAIADYKTLWVVRANRPLSPGLALDRSRRRAVGRPPA